MNKGINKFESLVIVSRLRSLHLLMGLVFVYFFFMTCQFPVLFRFLDKHQLPIPNRFVNETPRRQIPPQNEILSQMVFRIRNSDNSSIYKTAMQAWILGSELWAQLEAKPRVHQSPAAAGAPLLSCPEKVAVTESGFKGVVRLPCGLTLGSHVTVVGQPRKAHREKEPSISLGKDVMVAQFMVELRGERVVRGEEAARLLHFNPRIKGDWSEKPVIEMNHCYRGQWGTAVRCEGWRSPPTQQTDVHSVFAASLPTSHPSVASERHLEMSSEWKAQPLPHDPADLFIGVISSGDHFAERMAVRKSWMQHYLIKSSLVVTRFFVALHERETINVELRKEAEYFGDVIILPYMDIYDLVVLKTIAICDYGVNMLSTKHIMKCDDDTFVRVDAVIMEAQRINCEKSLYAGKLNYYHKPLRSGKWTVTYEEWPGEIYPPYADGPGYIISSDIARFIVTQFQQNRLRLFKMEDVSMGMWVEQFNRSKTVEYLHNSQFQQSGCIDNYYIAHYQSPKQLICLWERLQFEGKALCCNL
ncbi:Hydroxyproline O-galactosyltransferase GALT6 [Bienertia sinuspersici]